MRYSLSCFVLVGVLTSLSLSQSSSAPVHHVSRVFPVNAPHYEHSAERSSTDSSQVTPSVDNTTAPVHDWQLLATLPQTIIHDIAFPTPTLGYAVGEHGQVWKTKNAGSDWAQVLSAGDDYYFYGVAAISSQEIVVSGFFDSASTQYGLIRWSHDGGRTWDPEIKMGPAWLQRVRFARKLNGIVMENGGGSSPTNSEVTSNGGHAPADWTSVTSNPDGGWFDPQFSLLGNSHARASGINFCTSRTGGTNWTCGPSVDSVFDGPVFFASDNRGWVGGGEISPSVEGWVHVTTNGGKTWSSRTLDGPWPIRAIFFAGTSDGVAAGGDFYTGVGGIYFTSDGGNTWSIDATTNAEMSSCTRRVVFKSFQQRRFWCAGYYGNASSYSSVIYSAWF